MGTFLYGQCVIADARPQVTYIVKCFGCMKSLCRWCTLHKWTRVKSCIQVWIEEQTKRNMRETHSDLSGLILDQASFPWLTRSFFFPFLSQSTMSFSQVSPRSFLIHTFCIFRLNLQCVTRDVSHVPDQPDSKILSHFALLQVSTPKELEHHHYNSLQMLYIYIFICVDNIVPSVFHSFACLGFCIRKCGGEWIRVY